MNYENTFGASNIKQYTSPNLDKPVRFSAQEKKSIDESETANFGLRKENFVYDHGPEPIQEAPKPKFCMECGEKFPNEKVKFCGECGSKRFPQ